MAFGNATKGYVKSHGGGGGGTSNYNDLSNKPSINGVTLSGNKSSSDLGITVNFTELQQNDDITNINGIVVVGVDSYNQTFSAIFPKNTIVDGAKLVAGYDESRSSVAIITVTNNTITWTSSGNLPISKIFKF